MLRIWQPDTDDAPRQPLLDHAGTRCLVLVAILKLVFFLLDPLPKFFQGDSFSYLATANSGWIPPDRSFTYGWMIRGLTACAQSLTPLIAVQCMAGVLVCMLVYHIARRHLRASPMVATAAACCCAVEPMQLYYERAVMTEAFSTASLILCVAIALAYTVKPQLRTLLLLTLLTLLPVSLRVALVPCAIALCLLPPLLLMAKDVFSRWSRGFSTWRSCVEETVRCVGRSPYLGHFVATCACVLAMHLAYCHWAGRSGHLSYVPHDGFFQIAGLAPIVTASDAADPRVAEVIASFDESELRDRNRCCEHIFWPNGLVRQLKAKIPDEAECSALAKATAGNALRRAPHQAAALGMATWLDYGSIEKMKNRLVFEQGEDLPIAEPDVRMLQERFTLAATGDWALRPTVTKWMHLNLRGEYYLLVALPLLAIAVLLGSRKRNWIAISLLCAGTITPFVTACLFSQPDLRYLHVSGCVAPLLLVEMWEQVRMRHAKIATEEDSREVLLPFDREGRRKVA